MNTIKRKAYAKINLVLDVVRRREDGYHEVRMVMQNVDIYDELTFAVSENPGIHIKVDAEDIPTDENNLIYKAAHLLMTEAGIEKGVDITLKKVIPVAAGMAGGSTDAAAAFWGINELFELGKTEEELREMGVKIGADIPYCIMGGTALSEGIGEVLTKLPAPPHCFLVIAKPEIYVSTKYVYENLHANEMKEHPNVDGMLEKIKEKDLHGMCEYMDNVLETVTGKEYPIISRIEDCMMQNGAIKALMSGSGPTVFGIFETEEAAKRAYGEIEKENLAKQIFVTTFVNEKEK